MEKNIAFILILLVVVILTIELYAHNKSKKRFDAKITGMTLATTKMIEMKTFYTDVFEVDFEAVERFGGVLFEGSFGSIKLTLCPAEIAKNTAKQNRHQLELIVTDIKNTIYLVRQNNGKVLGEMSEADGRKSIAISDPDGNSMVLSQHN